MRPAADGGGDESDHVGRAERSPHSCRRQCRRGPASARCRYDGARGRAGHRSPPRRSRLDTNSRSSPGRRHRGGQIRQCDRQRDRRGAGWRAPAHPQRAHQPQRPSSSTASTSPTRRDDGAEHGADLRGLSPRRWPRRHPQRVVDRADRGLRQQDRRTHRRRGPAPLRRGRPTMGSSRSRIRTAARNSASIRR